MARRTPAAAPARRCYVYLRVSDLDPKKESNVDSLNEQFRVCSAHAASLGWSPADVVELREQYSGEELDFRPKINEAITAAQSGANVCLVFKRLDRLSREPSDMLTIIRKLRRAGCRIECVEEPVGESDEDVLLTFIKGYAAHREWKAIRKRSMDGKQAIVRRGKQLRRRPRYGYRMHPEDRVLVVDAAAAAVVLRVFRDAAEGYSATRIATDLNAEGVPSPSAHHGHAHDRQKQRWSTTTVANMIREESYLGGVVIWNRTRCVERMPNGDFRKAKLPRDQWTVVETDAVTAPPVVTRDLWDAANAVLAGNAAAHKTRNDRTPNLLRGRITCARCGNPCYTALGGRHGKPAGESPYLRYYRCKAGSHKDLVTGARCPQRMIGADWIEAQVWAKIVEVIGDRDAIRDRIRAAAGDDAQVATIRATIAEREMQLDEERTLIGQMMEKWKEAARKNQTVLATMFEGQLSLSEAKIVAVADRLALDRSRLAGLATSEESRASFESLLDAVRGLLAGDDGDPPFEVKERIVAALRVEVVGDGRDCRVRFQAVRGLDSLDAVSARLCSQKYGNSIPIEFALSRDLFTV